MNKRNVMEVVVNENGIKEKLPYKGFVKCSYKKLLGLFGLPKEGDLHRQDVLWDINLSVGRSKTYPVQIYNYKNGANFLGEDGLELDDIKTWFVSANNDLVVPLLQTYLVKAKVKNIKKRAEKV